MSSRRGDSLRGRMEKDKRSNIRGSRTNNRIPTKTGQERMV
jgi:hypothetical protein